MAQQLLAAVFNLVLLAIIIYGAYRFFRGGFTLRKLALAIAGFFVLVFLMFFVGEGIADGFKNGFKFDLSVFKPFDYVAFAAIFTGIVGFLVAFKKQVIGGSLLIICGLVLLVLFGARFISEGDPLKIIPVLIMFSIPTILPGALLLFDHYRKKSKPA